jgi:hypothetical protein
LLFICLFFSESSAESLFSSCLYVVCFLFFWFVLNFQLFVWIIYIIFDLLFVFYFVSLFFWSSVRNSFSQRNCPQ